MSVHPTIKHISRGTLAATTALASLALAGPAAAATEPTVTSVTGNPSCASFGPGFEEVKLEPVRQGRTTFSGGFIVVRGTMFEWSVPAGVDAVIVKGGPNANVYTSGDGDELTGGSFFHAPVNPGSGNPYGLSHISFCSNGVDDAPGSKPVTPEPGPCEPGGASTMPDGKPCSEVAPTTTEAQPCTGHMPDGSPCAPAEPPAGEVLGDHASGGAAQTAAGARLNTPRTCVSGAFRTVVRGKGIRRVTLSVNGRRVRTFAGGRTRYALRVDPAAHPTGVMRIVARVQFVRSSGRSARTLRATVLRCAVSQAQAPSFTG